jgi:hypothetical protein
LSGGMSPPEPESMGAVGSTAVEGVNEVAGAGGDPLSKTTALLPPPELPRTANTIATTLATPMRPAATRSVLRLPPLPASRGGG